MIGSAIEEEIGLPKWLSGKKSACQAVDPCLLWVRKWQPSPACLPGKSHGPRRLAGYSPWGCKESDMTEWLTLSLGRIRRLECILSTVTTCVYGKNFFHWLKSTKVEDILGIRYQNRYQQKWGLDFMRRWGLPSGAESVKSYTIFCKEGCHISWHFFLLLPHLSAILIWNLMWEAWCDELVSTT